jgi:hypothetical protein
MGDDTAFSSSKKSFTLDTPKGKQSSILNFFNSKKTNADSSFTEEIPSASSLVESSPALSAKVASLPKSSETARVVSTVPLPKQHSCDSSLRIPKILNDFGANGDDADFDAGENQNERYSWLVDVRDAEGHRPGKNESCRYCH